MKNPRTLPRVLHCLVQAPEGSPLAFTLDVPKVCSFIILLLLAFGFSFLGTLFFFRELEINRKLQSELIESQLKTKVERSSASLPQGTPLGIETLPSTPDLLNSAAVPARLGNLGLECQLESCTASVELLPSGTGISQGELLIVLETEVPRIGMAGPHSKLRKRYILYPGFSTRDELGNAEISTIEKRSFRFSSALHTSAEFKLPNLLKPLALNVYLFDLNKALIRHERKTIETEEAYAN